MEIGFQGEFPCLVMKLHYLGSAILRGSVGSQSGTW